MTFKEKLAKEHPDCFFAFGSPVGCPNTYEYESLDDNLRACATHTCKECWNREIPDIENKNTSNSILARG